MIWRGNWRSKARRSSMSFPPWGLPRRKLTPAPWRSTRRCLSASISVLTPKKRPLPRDLPAPLARKRRSRPRSTCRTFPGRETCCARSSKKKLLPVPRLVPWPSRPLLRHRLQPSRRLPPRRHLLSSRTSQLWNLRHRNLLHRLRWRPRGRPQLSSFLPNLPCFHRRRRVRAQLRRPLPFRRVPHPPCHRPRALF